MKICVFADIHGNIDALKKMFLVEKEDTDLFVFAGDVFGYFYNQVDVITAFMDMPNLLAVKGNHDHYYLSGKRGDYLQGKYGSSYRLTLPALQREFLCSLPDTVEINAGGKNICIYHGGPSDFLEQRIYPDTVIRENDLYDGLDYLFVGHTHYRFSKRIWRTLVINPGSLGQPRDGYGFSYCLITTDTDEWMFKTVDVDVYKLLGQVKEIDGEREVYTYLERKYRKL